MDIDLVGRSNSSLSKLSCIFIIYLSAVDTQSYIGQPKGT